MSRDADRPELHADWSPHPRGSAPRSRGPPRWGPIRAAVAPHLGARQDGVQARVLRLRARLPVAADAPAAAVRRHLSRRQPLEPGVGSKDPYFPAALLLGVVLFNFFAESTAGGVSCLVDRENLVRKIEFPRLAVPVSIVLTALMNLGAEPDPGGDLPVRRRRLAPVELARVPCWCSRWRSLRRGSA